ncbi:hypothetical protein [Conexibacter woesei]|uniref:Uncharacterized protein n=1 Tax=Conexibacter woesei (strain DSM 14684 / CCUG 47730 / CIP 108061 / JCM 11494 / NBRC 100937 / ID131577) TaxID=469383 RepID=D3F055_CONWI|nr:hypothetical protein [Conexibacter woesei]ADB50031.1 hypothetical protein Cwoe_1603 [Conexibacter woesei DSM 14684]
MTSGVPFGSGPEEGAADAEPTTEQPPVTAPPPLVGAPPSASGAPPLAIPGIPLDRPELHVGAAFVGGLLLATVLKRFAR